MQRISLGHGFETRPGQTFNATIRKLLIQITEIETGVGTKIDFHPINTLRQLKNAITTITQAG